MDIYFIIGGLIPTFLISRTFHYFFKKIDYPFRKSILSNLLSLALISLLAGFGMADGRDGIFIFEGFKQYLIPQLIIFGTDYLRFCRVK
jgi:hypothetical protein